jgi:hypothetical protein
MHLSSRSVSPRRVLLGVLVWADNKQEVDWEIVIHVSKDYYALICKVTYSKKHFSWNM